MKLIIINGPCGVGKSTIAEKLHDSLPLSYLLDIDALRRNISHYREHKKERLEIGYSISLAIADTCLSLGRDVVVDKMMYHPATLDTFHKLAKKYKADVYEIILWADKKSVIKRAEKRGYRPGSLLTREKTNKFWEELNRLKNHKGGNDRLLINLKQPWLTLLS